MNPTAQERRYNEEEGEQKPHASLHLAAQTVQEDQDFMRKIRKKFHKASIEPQKDHKALEKQIENFDNQMLRSHAATDLNAANMARDHWTEKGEHGSGRLKRSIQDFSTKFAGFLRVYSGFIDVVRQAGGCYADVAYGTLSIFFTVAVSKSEIESEIVDTLEELQNSFPRVSLLDDIYPEPSVKERVSKVYRGAILFARECTEYFLDASLNRVLKAILKPATVGIKRKTEKLLGCLADLNAEVGILLHHRIQRMTSEIGELLIGKDILIQKMTKMEVEAADKASRIDLENLENFRRTLQNVPQKYMNPHVCRRTLKAAFPEALQEHSDKTSISAGWSQKYVQITRGLLEESPEYAMWRESPTSRLLLLGGFTSDAGQASKSTLSWLSPATLHVFDALSATGEKVAFHCCHPNINSTENSIRLIVSNLLYQVLGWAPEILRHRVKEFDSAARSEDLNSHDDKKTLQACFDLLGKALEYDSSQEKKFLIIDRVDLCQGLTSRFLDALQKLVSNSRSMLKVMVVMGRIFDHYDREACQDLISSPSSCAFGRMNWDQDRKVH